MRNHWPKMLVRNAHDVREVRAVAAGTRKAQFTESNAYLWLGDEEGRYIGTIPTKRLLTFLLKLRGRCWRKP